MNANIFLSLSLFITLIYAQSDQIGININNPHPSAVLEIFSNDKGVLIPRLTEKQMKEIHAPKAGLILFNTTRDCMVVREDEGWSGCLGREPELLRFSEESSELCYRMNPEISALLHSPGWAKVSFRPKENSSLQMISQSNEWYTSNNPNANSGDRLTEEKNLTTLINDNLEGRYLYYKAKLEIKDLKYNSQKEIICNGKIGEILPLPEGITYNIERNTLLGISKEKMTHYEYNEENSKVCRDFTPKTPLKIVGSFYHYTDWLEAIVDKRYKTNRDMLPSDYYWVKDGYPNSKAWVYNASEESHEVKDRNEKFYGLCKLDFPN